MYFSIQAYSAKSLASETCNRQRIVRVDRWSDNIIAKDSNLLPPVLFEEVDFTSYGREDKESVIGKIRRKSRVVRANTSGEEFLQFVMRSEVRRSSARPLK
jgi:hypothetical protein